MRSPIARSASGMSAILARTSRSPSARSSAGLRRDAVFRSRALACIAARSSSVQTFAVLSPPLRLLVVVFASVMARLPWVRTSSVRTSSVVSVVSAVSSGRRRHRRALGLEYPDRVAERVAEAHVGSVEVVDRLLREVGDAPLLKRVIQAAGVIGVE